MVTRTLAVGEKMGGGSEVTVASLTDAQLAERCKGGDNHAMAALFHRFRSRVFSVAMRITGPQNAEEVLQESFIRVFRGIHKFRGDSALSTWIYRLSVNTALSYLRKHKRHTRGRESLADYDGPIEPQRRDLGLSKQLESAMLELPAGYRAVLVLHDVEGLNHEECAKIMGCRVGTSKSQLHKARARMRQLLSERGVC